MTMRSAPSVSCCKSSSMRSFRPAAKRASEKKWKWPEYRPNESARSALAFKRRALRSIKLFMATTMEIDPQLVKQLREKTNAGFMDCKRALAEAGGNLEKAETVLRTKGRSEER